MGFMSGRNQDREHKAHGHKKVMTTKERKALNHIRLMNMKENPNPDKKVLDMFKDKKAS